MRFKKVKIYNLLFVIGYVLVFVVTCLPIGGKLNRVKVFSGLRLDHLLHFSLYFLMTLYYLLGRRNNQYLFNTKPLLKYLCLIVFLALSTEVCQLWIPSRSFNLFDIIANLSGVLIGFIVISLVCKDKA